MRCGKREGVRKRRRGRCGRSGCLGGVGMGELGASAGDVLVDEDGLEELTSRDGSEEGGEKGVDSRGDRIEGINGTGFLP